MLENSPIRLQARQIAGSLGANIKSCNDVLYELRRLTMILFTQTRAGAADIRAWFEKEGFGIDEDGFWTRLPLLAAFRENRAPRDAVSHSWHPDLRGNRDACFRMYCLRHMGTCLAEIRSRLPGTAWIYYQDVTNTSIQFPYIDQITAITPDFDWSAYHTYVSVSPENNPERGIQWTSPTIDYAGEGLIVSVSIPLYLADSFTGLWSIDIPLKSLYQDMVFDTCLSGQVNFIIDSRGSLVAHPSIEAKIDPEKGSVFRRHIRDMGRAFKDIRVEDLLKTGHGRLLLDCEGGRKLVAWYETIPGIGWIFFATVPRRSMEDAVNRRIREALDRVKSGDLSYRLRDISDIDRARMVVDGFNEMASVLESQERIRRETREENERMEKRLQRFQRMEAIGNLAGGIAHDFNNILSPIMGYSEMLFQDLDKESRQYEMVEHIYKAAARARELIRQILTFSRHTDMENSAVSFQSIAREALNLLRSSIPRDIDIHQKIRSDCPPVFGDATKLHQVIMNLCTNAFHAVQETGGGFEVALEPVEVEPDNLPAVQGLPAGSYVRLTVSDNGHGMDAETMIRIFDPYFTTKEEGKGTGLGLSVTYGIVRKLNGDVKVYSEPGKGSTFQVFLPVANLPERKEKPSSKDIGGGTERILLVDDEKGITNMVCQALERYGYRVTAFNESLPAFNAFSDDPGAFDLVITDMTMPGMTGNVLAGRIKEIRRDIPVILCTGFSEKISNGNYKDTAIDEFLMKPVSVKIFNRAIRRLLDRPAEKKD